MKKRVSDTHTPTHEYHTRVTIKVTHQQLQSNALPSELSDDEGISVLGLDKVPNHTRRIELRPPS